jgi:hypothetical protein
VTYVFQVFLISLCEQGPEVTLRQNPVLPIEQSNLQAPTIQCPLLPSLPQLVDCTKVHWRPYQFKSRINPAPYSELDSNEEAADRRKVEEPGKTNTAMDTTQHQ